MATLSLNTAPRTSVFRKLVEIVQNDPTIKRVISRPASFRAWTGKPVDGQPFSVDIAPAVRFTPIQGPDSWYSPNAQKGPLFVNVEMLIQGSDADDVMNLWWAIQRAIYPAAQEDLYANLQVLQQAGAHDGLAEFTLPAFDPGPRDNFWAATGQIKIMIRNQLLA